MSQPWVKFYPSDWMADPKVKLCSRETRSFWIDILCLLWESETGRLEVNGRPASDKQIAAMTGDNPRTVRKMLAELLGNGVCSIEDGFVINRRIIRDRIKAEKDRENGAKGGSPLLKNNTFPENWVIPQKPEARSQKPDKVSDDKSSSVDLEIDDPANQVIQSSEIDDAVSCWNLAAEKAGWKTTRMVSPDRRAKLRSRLKEHGLDGWKEALRRALRSEQLGHDPPSWFNFDFLIKNSGNILKVLEGNYDKRFGSNGNGTGFVRPEPELNSVAQAALARRAERARGEQELF